MTPILRQIVIVLAFIVMVALNIASTSNSGQFRNKTPSDLSGSNQTPITPAGFAFSVWGLIYTFVGIFVVYQAFPSNRNNVLIPPVLAFWVPLSFICNGLWLICWPLDGWWTSIPVIGLYLYALVNIYWIFDEVERTHGDFSIKDRVLLRLGFSFNISWVLVANLLNFSVVLVHYGVSLNADWGIAWILFATTVCVYVLWTRFDIGYASILIWALIAIASKQHGSVATWSYAMIGVIVFAYLSGLLLKHYKVLPPTAADAALAKENSGLLQSEVV